MTAVDLVAPPPARIEAGLAAVAPVGTAELEKVLVDVLDAAGLARWFDDLAADPDAVDRLTAASCWHSNGFAKIVLHRGADCALRLHVWPTDRPQNGDTEPHSHRWDFASTVLVGALTVAEYRETDDPADLWFRRCTYDGRDVREDGPTRLRQRSTFQVQTAERYVTDRRVIHKVHPVPLGLVATLLVQGPHRSCTTAVYRLDGGPPPAREIDTGTVAELLRAVANALRTRRPADPQPMMDP